MQRMDNVAGSIQLDADTTVTVTQLRAMGCDVHRFRIGLACLARGGRDRWLNELIDEVGNDGADRFMRELQSVLTVAKELYHAA